MSVNTNPVVVRRITGQLARAGLVRVQRGPGGAELTRQPREITLCDIWQAINHKQPGPLLPLHAFPNQACPIGAEIHALLGRAFASVEDAMRDALQQTTLAELLAPLQVTGGLGQQPVDRLGQGDVSGAEAARFVRG